EETADVVTPADPGRRTRERYAPPVGTTVRPEDIAELLSSDEDGRLLVVTLGAAGLDQVVAYWYERAVPNEVWIVTDPALVRVNFSGAEGRRRALMDTYSWALVREPELQIETL